MPKWRAVNSRIVRLGPCSAVIAGAGLAWFSVFIFYALAGSSEICFEGIPRNRPCR